MRNVLAVVVGLIAAVIIIFGIESLSTILFPLPEGADPMNSEWLKDNMDVIPTGSMIIVAIAHLIGIICGMFLAGIISKTSMIPAYIVGVLLLVATIVNLIMVPHPSWFMITDIIGALIGLGIGKLFAAKRVAAA